MVKIFIDGKEASDKTILWPAEKMEIEAGMHSISLGIARVVYGAAMRGHGMDSRKIEIKRA